MRSEKRESWIKICENRTKLVMWTFILSHFLILLSETRGESNLSLGKLYLSFMTFQVEWELIPILFFILGFYYAQWDSITNLSLSLGILPPRWDKQTFLLEQKLLIRCSSTEICLSFKVVVASSSVSFFSPCFFLLAFRAGHIYLAYRLTPSFLFTAWKNIEWQERVTP